jgi:hypothetical protein
MAKLPLCYLIKHNFIKIWGTGIQPFSISALDGENGKLHAKADLTPGKCP